MKILIIAAHPDDEVLGMGGTIKKLTKNKHKVKVIFMATGIFSRRSMNYKNSPNYESNEKFEKIASKQMNNLRKNAKDALKILGVNDIEFFNFPDNEMDLVSNLEITKTIEKVIEDFDPSVVYTHFKDDVNIDHRLIYNAVVTATRPTQNSNVKKVYSFEVPSSTEWFFPNNFSPNVFVDIEKELQFKIKSMSKYKNELQKFPHPRSLKALDIISKRWGTVCGYNAAEPFYLVREISENV